MVRESIFSALFALTQNVTWITTTTWQPRTWADSGRRLKTFGDASKPAIYQMENAEEATQKSGLPFKFMLEASWWIYQDTAKDATATPATENSNILDALQAAITAKPSDPGYANNRNTLGGLVYHCCIEGRIFKDPGDIDDWGMMIIPIKILVP